MSSRGALNGRGGGRQEPSAAVSQGPGAPPASGSGTAVPETTAAPLDAQGIPYIWEPYPPERMPGYRYAYGSVDRPFTLLVPKSLKSEAASVLRVTPGSASVIGSPAPFPHSEESQTFRWYWLFTLLAVVFGADLVSMLFWGTDFLGGFVQSLLNTVQSLNYR